MGLHTKVFILGLAIILSACQRTDPNVTRGNFGGSLGSNGELTSSEESNSFSCTATPSNTQIQISNGTATVPVTVRVFGGTGNYSIAAGSAFSGISAFGGNTSIIASWSSSGAKQESVLVTDNGSNLSTSCDFAVNVQTDFTIACDMLLDNSNPAVGTEVAFAFMVSGAVGNYRFRFYPDYTASNPQHFSLVKELTSTDKQAAYAYTYTSKGIKNPKVYVKNLTTQVETACSVDGGIQVREPDMVVTATPSTVVTVEETISLNAEVEDFIGTPTITYSVDSNQVTLVQNGNTATLSTSTSNSITTLVTVIADDGEDQVEVSGNVTFAPVTSCTIEIEGGATEATVNEEVVINLTASNGENVVITEIEANGASLLSGENTPVRLKFSTSGHKAIKVAAKTSTSGAICNSGAKLEVPIHILPNLSCNISTAPRPSPTSAPVYVTVTAQGAGANANIVIDRFATNTAAGMTITSENGLSKTVQFYYNGIWPVLAEIRDTNTGRTASCETQHYATIYSPNCRAEFLQDGAVVTSARKEDKLQFKVYSNVRSYSPWYDGRVSIAPGAAVLASPSAANVFFPVTAQNITYNAVGNFTARADVTDLDRGGMTSCYAGIQVTPEASCTMTGPSQTTLVATHRRGNTFSDEGPSTVDYDVNVAHAKLPLEIDVTSGSGQDAESGSVNSSQYTASIDFKYSGVYTPSVSFTDKFDLTPDSCSPGAVHVNKLTNVYYSGAYNHYFTVQVCNSTPELQTIWIMTPGSSPATYDFHNIPVGGCKKKSFYTTNKYEAHVGLKTLWNYNTHKHGLTATVCRGYNNTSCGITFPDL